ncbi:MAG: LysM peptidoglycan-binding domain-containing protein [Prevotellaceae bacterium]|jgi:LysM repeat protein|nr:LysM peptidoglycan-binding domain-containing protein [Prevotellaceae bacterium]
MKSRFFSTFILICLPVFLTAQMRSPEIVKINGLNYYMHTIKDGETLESIAKLYNVTEIDVEENNPTVLATGKLKTGMRLRIPDLSEVSKEYPLSQWDFTYYQVKTKVKLKDIAKEYNIDVKDIKKNNPEISNKPIILSKVRIPLKKGSKEALAYAKYPASTPVISNPDNNEKNNDATNPALAFNWRNEKDSVKPNTATKEDDTSLKFSNKDCKIQNYNPKKQSYNISFLLPLRLMELSKKDYSYVSFLEGALMAVEKMKNEGFSAKITIKDAYDKASLSKALDDKDVEKSDLIIGPFALNLLQTASAFSKKNDIPLVSPYEIKAETLVKDNPYLFQIYPVEAYMNRELFQKTVDESLINVVLVYSLTPDSIMLKTYQESIKKTFNNYTDYVHKIGLRPEAGRNALAVVLKKDIPNLIFVASNDEAFVSDLLDRLMVMNSNRTNTIIYPITIYGTMQWHSFKMVNLTNYYALNMHIVQPFYIDYTDDDVKSFIHAYRQNYSNEPTQYAFQGYDITYYFLSALKNYGKDFKNCVNNLDIKLLQSRYKFDRFDDKNSGYANTKSFLLEYTPEMNVIKH